MVPICDRLGPVCSIREFGLPLRREFGPGQIILIIYGQAQAAVGIDCFNREAIGIQDRSFEL